MKRAPEYKGIEVQGMAQRRAGLPVRTGTRIHQIKHSMKGASNFNRPMLDTKHKFGYIVSLIDVSSDMPEYSWFLASNP